MRPRWTLAQTLLVTGILGAGAGLVARDPRAVWSLGSDLILPIAVVVGVGYAIRRVVHLRLRYRLAIESATLLALLGLSAVTWNPYTA